MYTKVLFGKKLFNSKRINALRYPRNRYFSINWLFNDERIISQD